jgi:GxxExxY protein
MMTHTIGSAIAVHRALGPGFLESIYRKAMCVELEARGISFEVERPVRVAYRGVEIPGQRVDLVVGGLIVVELKTVVRIDRVHVGQFGEGAEEDSPLMPSCSSCFVAKRPSW